MLRVLAITGGKNVPSAIFRIRQYVDFVKGDEDVIINESIPLLSCYCPYKGLIRYLYYLVYLVSRSPVLFLQFRYDLIFLQREFVPSFYTLERFLFKPIIYDVDDAVFIGRRNFKTQRSISKRAKRIIVSTDYLKNWYNNYCKTDVIPTSINCDRYIPFKESKGQRYIGWVGTSNNFWHLDFIEESLSKFLNANTDWKLRIISDQKYIPSKINQTRVENIKWSYENDVKLINSFSIGIMPLVNDDWTKGKASFKLLQYMACGIPAVASNTGNNQNVGYDLPSVKLVQGAEWFDVLNQLARNLNKIDTTPALLRVKELYSIQSNFKLLIAILNEVYRTNRP